MEIKGIVTARGGKVHFHEGKDGSPATTNLWDRFGWYCITDEEVVKQIKGIAERSFLLTDVSSDVAELLTAIPDPSAIGYPKYKTDKATVKAIPVPSVSPVSVVTPSEKPVAPPPSAKPVAPPPSAKPYTKEEYKTTKEEIKVAFKKAWDFFSEFNFHPKDRMLDTLSHCKTYEKAKMYVRSYFALCNHPERNGVAEKIKSDEFRSVWNAIRKFECPDWVNKRLEIFWGEPSGGKSTEARNRYPNAKRFKVGPSMTDDELIQVFDFTDETGKPHFYDSVLVEAMKNGEPIIIDEINHLKYETLVGMQDFLDNTDKFVTSRKEEVIIKDGFKIIGTMNLDIDGAVFSLPEAIVDRCYNLEEFETTPEVLAGRFVDRFYGRG